MGVQLGDKDPLEHRYELLLQEQANFQKRLTEDLGVVQKQLTILSKSVDKLQDSVKEIERRQGGTLERWAKILIGPSGMAAIIATIIVVTPTAIDSRIKNIQENVKNVREDLHAVDDKVRGVVTYVRAFDTVQSKRWCIAIGNMCSLNKGPFSRGVPDECCTGLDTEPNGKYTAWKTKESWPSSPQTP